MLLHINSCFSQSHQFTIEVEFYSPGVKELFIGEAYWKTLVPYHAANFASKSAVSARNTFVFHGSLLYPTAVRISSDNDSIDLNVFLFIDTGYQKVTILKGINGYTVQTESAIGKEYRTFLKFMKMKAIDERINSNLFYKYIQMNPGSYVALYALLNQAFRYPYPPELKRAGCSFSNKIQNTHAFQFYQQLYRPNTVGARAPYFKVLDAEGKLITLAHYKKSGNVLLYFWASWCVYCRDLTPLLKSLKNHPKNNSLKIIAVSVDTDSISWKNAIEKESLSSWINIRSPLFFEQPDNTIRLDMKYSVLSYPTVLLIDMNGKIVGRFENTSSKSMIKELNNLISQPGK